MKCYKMTISKEQVLTYLVNAKSLERATDIFCEEGTARMKLVECEEPGVDSLVSCELYEEFEEFTFPKQSTGEEANSFSFCVSANAVGGAK